MRCHERKPVDGIKDLLWLVLNIAMIDANSSAPDALCCVKLFISATARLI